MATDRMDTYGHPLDNFGIAADIANALFGKKLSEPLLAEDIGLLMVGLKLARESYAPKRDNLVDIAGYAKTIDLVHEERSRRESHGEVA